MSYRRSDVGTTLSARDLAAVMGARSGIGAVLAQQEQMAAVSFERPERFGALGVRPRRALVGPVIESRVTVTPVPIAGEQPLRETRSRSIISELEKLADLKERGLITREELVIMKNRLLNR